MILYPLSLPHHCKHCTNDSFIKPTHQDSPIFTISFTMNRHLLSYYILMCNLNAASLSACMNFVFLHATFTFGLAPRIIMSYLCMLFLIAKIIIFVVVLLPLCVRLSALDTTNNYEASCSKYLDALALKNHHYLNI